MPLVLLRSRLQDFIINFLKNIFTSVLAPQTAIASLGGPGMIRKENEKDAFKTQRRKGKNKTLARCFYRQDYKKIGSVFFILRII